MTTVQEAHGYFIQPLSRRFSAPPSGNVDEFYSDLAVELAKYSRYQLESAAREITRSRTQRGFPTFAECISAVDRQPSERPQPTGAIQTSSTLEDWKRQRDAERAAAQMCRCALGEQARNEGWLPTLLEYVQERGRLPIKLEIERLKQRAREVDEAGANCGALTPLLGKWRGYMHGRAAERVFGGDQKQAAE